MSPWLARNYLLFHRLIPIRDNFGVQLKLGNLPGEKGLFKGDTYPSANQYELKRLAEMGEAEYDAAAQQEALNTIRAHPAEFVVNTIRRVGYWWMGIPVESQSLGSLRFLKNFPLAAFSVVAFWGVVRTVRTRNRGGWLFVAVLLLYPIAYYVTHTASLGYMYPIHPEMLALATSAVFRDKGVSTGAQTQGTYWLGPIRSLSWVFTSGSKRLGEVERSVNSASIAPKPRGQGQGEWH
jgi:hypothetical protein